eukprot:1158031-Pelagomonas_calceolata.AAC.4
MLPRLYVTFAFNLAVQCTFPLKSVFPPQMLPQLLCFAVLLPPKDRPKTSTTVARRLMSHALGLPGMRDRKGERELAEARKQAKEDRRARQQAAEESKAAAWGDG